MPQGFDFPYPLDADKPDMWLNVALRDWFGWNNILNVVGRLKAGVSLAQAQAEVHTIAERIACSIPKFYKDEDVSVVPLSGISYYTSQRTHEIGIRMTLGAQRADVMRLVLREGMLIVGLGLAIGIVAAGRSQERWGACYMECRRWIFLRLGRQRRCWRLWRWRRVGYRRGGR